MAIKIGVLCPSEIALRRFMPAVALHTGFEYIGIAVADEDEWFGEQKMFMAVREKELAKAQCFQESYGWKIYGSYSGLIQDKDCEAVYIPLPPALHFKWAKQAMMNGKHVFVEKPFTTCGQDTGELLRIAEENELAAHENYTFIYHSQIEYICGAIADGQLGDVRLIRLSFGFPFRSKDDFRYNKSLGGGALLDCGGYTLKLAAFLLGEDIKIASSSLRYRDGIEVDLYGSATLENKRGDIAQLAFGMDNSYKCDIEIWGSKGALFAGRVFTAPAGYEPVVVIKTQDHENTVTLPADDQFFNSLDIFYRCINDADFRRENQKGIIKQSQLVDAFLKGAER